MSAAWYVYEPGLLPTPRFGRAIAASHLIHEARRELLRMEVFAIVKDMLDSGDCPLKSRAKAAQRRLPEGAENARSLLQ